MRKAASGQGNLRRRPDGRWEGRLRREGKTISVYGPTQAQARRKLAFKAASADLGIPEPKVSSRYTVADLLDEWLLDLRLQGRLKPSTWQGYATLVRTQIKPRLGDMKLLKLDFEDLEGIYGEMRREGLSPNYIRSVHAALRTALRWGRRQRKLTSDPAGLVDRLSRTRNRHRGLTLEELVTVLEALQGHPYQAFFTTALMSGLRFGELAALRWQDLDLEENVLHVERGLSRITSQNARLLGLKENTSLSEPKTEASVRAVLVPEEVSDVLRSHRTRQRERFLRYGRRWSEKELVFQGQRFTPFQQSHTNYRWHQVQALAGIPGDRQVRLHDTRRTFATLEMGARQERVTQQRLGHTSATMTRHYQDVWSQSANVRHIESTLAEARAKHGIEEEIS